LTFGTGTIGGSTGSVDNSLIRSNGTGGVTIQASDIIIDDSENVTGVNTITASGIIPERQTDTIKSSGNTSYFNYNNGQDALMLLEESTGLTLSNIPDNAQGQIRLTSSGTFTLAPLASGLTIESAGKDNTATTLSTANGETWIIMYKRWGNILTMGYLKVN